MAEEVTEDAILGGRIRVRQPARGYRVNVDTVLLAAAVEANSGMRLMEAGCGVGAAVLAVSSRTPGASFLGVERDPALVALARENVVANAMAQCVEIVEGDTLDQRADWGVFDGIFFNPPFDAEGEGRSPSEARRSAHIAEATIDHWIAVLSNRLSGGGALTLIHRAAKLGEILAALDGRLGGVEVFPIRPKTSAPAKRIIVRARKGARTPLKLMRGLDLHDGSGTKHAPEAEAILRGEAALSWGD